MVRDLGAELPSAHTDGALRKHKGALLDGDLGQTSLRSEEAAGDSWKYSCAD